MSPEGGSRGSPDPSRWERVQKLFMRAMERPPEERVAFVEAKTRGDAELRADVERLIASMQTMTLVNEVRSHVFPRERKDREPYLAVASRAMRSVLVDHARRKRRAKRSADGVRVPLEDLVESYEARSGGLVELDAALERLAAVDPDMVRLVELRFFGGLRMEDVARNLGISLRTAQREWKTARAKLLEELG